MIAGNEQRRKQSQGGEKATQLLNNSWGDGGVGISDKEGLRSFQADKFAWHQNQTTAAKPVTRTVPGSIVVYVLCTCTYLR